jgi:hypothetical protein
VTDGEMVDEAVNPEPISRGEHSLRRLEGGGFVIDSPEGLPTRAHPGRGERRIDGRTPVGGCRLVRGEGPGERFLLLREDGRTEVGRSAALQPSEVAQGERDLVMEDGRAYRLLLQGPEDPRFELLGWETPGAYLTARPGSGGWVLTPEPSASGLREIGPLLVLVAAEILESEGEGRGQTTRHAQASETTGPASGPDTEA